MLLRVVQGLCGRQAGDAAPETGSMETVDPIIAGTPQGQALQLPSASAQKFSWQLSVPASEQPL